MLPPLALPLPLLVMLHHIFTSSSISTIALLSPIYLPLISLPLPQPILEYRDHHFCQNCSNHLHSISPPFCQERGVGNFQTQKRKLMPWRKSSCHGYLPGGRTMFQVKKDCKIKYGFDGSIPNNDRGLFYPNNQLMFSFLTFWFS